MKSCLSYVLCLLALAFAGHAVAEESGLYVGVATGIVSYDSGVSGTTGTAVLDEKDTGFKIFAGKKINKSIAIEGFYVDLGEASVKGNAGDVFVLDGTALVFLVNNAKLAAESSAFGFNGVFYLPLEELTLYAKAGIAMWDSSFTISGDGLPTTTISDKSGSDPFFGFGAQYQITSTMALGFDYDLYNIDDDNVSMMSLGLRVSF